MRQLSVSEPQFKTLCGALGLAFKDFYSQQEADRLTNYHHASTDHQPPANQPPTIHQPSANYSPTERQPSANQLATQLVGGEVERLTKLVSQVEDGAQQIAQQAGERIAELVGDIPRSALEIAASLTSQNQGILYTAHDAVEEVGAVAENFREQLSRRPRQLPSTAPTTLRQLRAADPDLQRA